MANIPTFAPTATGNFDPTQWSNQFSLYNNQAMPWPSTYAGAPTDAMGNPIASYQQPQAPQAPAAAPTPGMTLNSAPQIMGPGNFAQLAQQTTDPAQRAYYNSMQQSFLPQDIGGPAGSGRGYGSVGTYRPPSTMYWNPSSAPGAAQPQAAPAAAAAPNNWNAAITALANPGRVTTPGATVPQAAQNYQPGPGVLQQFLANWNPAQSGPGSGFQQAFANALQRGR